MGTIGAPSATVPYKHQKNSIFKNKSKQIFLFFSFFFLKKKSHLNKIENLAVLFTSLCIFDKINLVLQNNDMLQFHNFN